MEDLPGCRSPVDLASLPASSQEKLLLWFKSLPKYLWERGSKYLDTTAVRYLGQRPPCSADLMTAIQVVLAFLQRAASRPLLRFAEELPTLAPLLVPFFYISRPKGSMPGPYARLPPSIQAVARGVATYIANEAEDAGEALLEAVAKTT